MPGVRDGGTGKEGSEKEDCLSRTLIVFAILVLPLMCRFRSIANSELTGSPLDWWRGTFDLHHWYKSALLAVIAAVGIISVRWDRRLAFPAIFIGAVWAATFRGGYVALGVGGFPGLYEGALVWSAYLVLFALALRSQFALDWWILGAAITQAAAVVGQDRGFDIMDLIGHVSGAIDHSGTLYSPNYVGSFFALIVPFTLASAVDKRSKAALLVCAVSSYALYLSHSTAGAAGAAAGCAVFAASRLRVRDSFVFGAIILAALSMGNGKIQTGIVEIWRSFPAIPDTAISARAFIWRESIPLLPDVAVLGYGPGKFPLHFPQSHAAIMYGQVYGPQVIVDKVHSLYLQIIFAAGGIGMLAFVGTLGGVIGRNRDMRFVVACVGYLVAGFANDSVVSVAPIFWIMLGRASQKRILDN